MDYNDVMMEQQLKLATKYQIQELEEHCSGERVWCVDWDPSGMYLAVVGSNKTISIYRYSQPTKSLTKQQTIQTQHTKTIRFVKFSSHILNNNSNLNIPTTNHPILAVASFDSTISVWVTTNDQQQQTQEYQQLCLLEGHQNQVKCLSWNHDNTKLASCSRDKNIWVWEFDQISYQYTCQNVLEGHTQDVKYVQWITPTSSGVYNLNRLASCAYDDTIRIWQMEDDDYICRYVLNGHSSIVWCLSFNQECNYMVSSSEDCSIIVWKSQNSEQDGKYSIVKQHENYHGFPIYCCKMFEINNQMYLLTGSGDNSIKLSKIDKSGQILQLSSATHKSDINHINLRPSKNQNQIIFVSCSDDETIKLWNITPSQ